MRLVLPRPVHAAACLLPLAASGLVGCSDKGVTVHHEPPAVTIRSPAEGARFYQGQSVRFEALATVFGSEDVTDLDHSWVTGTSTMCASMPVNADGTAFCDFAFTEVGEQTVTVTVVDNLLDSAKASVRVNIDENTPPSITLNSPQNGDAYAPGSLVVFDATVSDAEDSAEQLVVTVSSSIDGALTMDGTPSSSGAWTGAGSLSNGDHLITVRVTDTGGRSDQATATVSVNARPGAPGVVISPDPAISGLALTANITSPAVDPEGDALTYRYDWYLNGTLYQSGSNDTVARGVTMRGQYWEVYAYANDGFGYGSAGTDGINIDNSVPSVTSARIAPTTPSTSDDLTATGTGWFDQDGDSELYRYEWTRNGAVDASETTATYPAGKTTKGDVLQVKLTPYDAWGTGTAVTSASVTILNAKPTAPVVAITPTRPDPSDNLYCGIVTSSTDADGDRVSYSYNWYKDGSLTPWTSNTVSSTYTAHGEGWECVVTPNDGEEDGSTGSDYVTINDGTAPDAPRLNTPEAYRNETSIDISGTCEAGCSLNLYCSDTRTTWSETGTCSSSGILSMSTTGTRGRTNSCYATCTDAAGNTSANSNTVSTEICDPYDSYEDSAGYGDSASASIAEWGGLSDAGTTTISIVGNMLTGDSADWYRISATDDVGQDVREAMDYFNFSVEMVEGTGAYEMYVYYGGYDTTDRECSTGSTEYNWYNYDMGDGSHTVPSDRRACYTGSHALYNDCADDSATFYIKVERKASVSMSCQHYELEILNGVW